MTIFDKYHDMLRSMLHHSVNDVRWSSIVNVGIEFILIHEDYLRSFLIKNPNASIDYDFKIGAPPANEVCMVLVLSCNYMYMRFTILPNGTVSQEVNIDHELPFFEECLLQLQTAASKDHSTVYTFKTDDLKQGCIEVRLKPHVMRNMFLMDMNPPPAISPVQNMSILDIIRKYLTV